MLDGAGLPYSGASLGKVELTDTDLAILLLSMELGPVVSFAQRTMPSFGSMPGQLHHARSSCPWILLWKASFTSYSRWMLSDVASCLSCSGALPPKCVDQWQGMFANLGHVSKYLPSLCPALSSSGFVNDHVSTDVRLTQDWQASAVAGISMHTTCVPCVFPFAEDPSQTVKALN